MTEEWRPIRGFEGLYAVSNMGRVRSEQRVVIRGDGRRHSVRERILSAARKKRGHLSVQLHKVGQAAPRLHVHRLVLLAFVGEPPTPLHEGAHGDGDPGNNALSNLRWATRSSNHADKLQHGTHNRGEAHPLCKLTDKAVRAIRSDGAPAKSIAATHGISTKYVWAIKAKTSRGLVT